MAGLFRVDRRFSNGFQMTASYALSRFKAFGSDALGLGATVTDLNNIRARSLVRLVSTVPIDLC